MTPFSIHVFCVVLQAINAGVVWGLGRHDVTIDWVFVQFDRKTGVIQPSVILKDVILIRLVFAFLLLDAMQYLVHCLFPAAYKRSIKNKFNWVRWVNYSVSAPIMNVCISILTGVHDESLVFVFLVTLIVMICGAFGELEDSVNHFIVGSLLYSTVWMFMMAHFIHGAAQSSPPAFVWSIIFILFVVESLFAVNEAARLMGAQNNYQTTDNVYTLLSLCAKVPLAYMIFGGIQAYP